MVWIGVVAFAVGFGALIIWGVRGERNDDPALGGGALNYMSSGPTMDDGDRGVIGPDDDDIEEVNRL